VLGSQHEQPADGGASLAWQVPWTERKWVFERSRIESAQVITNSDAFYSTRLILSTDDHLPNAIEAVAAFPSARACQDELQPLTEQPRDMSAAQALIALACPLLTPKNGDLKMAADLARDAEFIEARRAYYDWMRGFVSTLRSDGDALDDIRLDAASFEVARDELHRMLTKQREIIDRRERQKWWITAEYGMTIVGVSAAIGAALLVLPVAMGVAGALAGFGGWLAGKRSSDRVDAPRPLGGASMFVMAENRIDWAHRL
jgi:hypothetical protein